MTIGPVLEVIVGLIFMFFVFSVLSSGINEYLSRALSKRVDFLVAGIAQLLDDGAPQDEQADNVYIGAFWSHPLVTQLGQSLEGVEPGWRQRLWARMCDKVERRLSSRTGKAAQIRRRQAEAALPGDEPRRLPSYIPTATFVAVLDDVTRAHPPADGTPLKVSLASLDDADPAQKAKNRARWFEDQMDRVTGWYKRDSKTILFVIGAIIVVAMNVDTIAVASTLWRDPTTRAAVNQAVQAQVDAARQPTTTAVDGAAPPPPLQVVCGKAAQVVTSPTTSAATTSSTSAQDALRGTLECGTKLPVGWRFSKVCYTDYSSPPTECDGLFARPADVFWSIVRRPTGALLKLAGLLITAGALSFGAPFWFDFLNRFANLRSTGAKPPTATTK